MTIREPICKVHPWQWIWSDKSSWSRTCKKWVDLNSVQKKQTHAHGRIFSDTLTLLTPLAHSTEVEQAWLILNPWLGHQYSLWLKSSKQYVLTMLNLQDWNDPDWLDQGSWRSCWMMWWRTRYRSPLCAMQSMLGVLWSSSGRNPHCPALLHWNGDDNNVHLHIFTSAMLTHICIDVTCIHTYTHTHTHTHKGGQAWSEEQIM